jgi:hypothetical protein
VGDNQEEAELVSTVEEGVMMKEEVVVVVVPSQGEEVEGAAT